MATEARAAGDFDREAEHWRRAATDAEQLSGEEGARLKVRFTQDAERAEAHAAQRRAAEAEAAAHARAEAKAAAAAQEAAHAPEAEPQRRPSLNAELTLRPDPGPDVRAPFPVSSRRR
jgi:biotin carboxyl carrier protein